jgi:acetylornithine deacetylase/succinyl-diaminopimelate desuccinylase-like protein
MLSRLVGASAAFACLLFAPQTAGGGARALLPRQLAPPAVAQAEALMKHPRLAAAFAHVDREREATLREWVAITEINAPSGHERERAQFVERLLRKYGLSDVRYDRAGNLVAVRKGTGGGPKVVFDSHLDTVFQPGLKIKATIKDGRVYAPGIGDDTRNVEAMLAMIRALDAAKIKTRGDLVFLFTVEEESSMRGATEYVAENKDRIGHYIALDGGYEGFTYGCIGINWYRHHFVGPGGHTRSRTPPYSATLPLARAIQRIYLLETPRDIGAHINIGMLGGSEVVNAKAADAWFSLDLRSTSNEWIGETEKRIADIVREEAEREKMTVKTEVVSRRAAAQVPGHRESYLVRTSEAVHRAMGFDSPPVTLDCSNNASPALAAGVSAISTGAGPCSDSHALTENCQIEPLYKGIKKLLLLGVVLSQLSE